MQGQYRHPSIFTGSIYRPQIVSIVWEETASVLNTHTLFSSSSLPIYKACINYETLCYCQNLEMTQSIWEEEPKLYAKTILFYINNLSTCNFAYSGRFLEPISLWIHWAANSCFCFQELSRVLIFSCFSFYVFIRSKTLMKFVPKYCVLVVLSRTSSFFYLGQVFLM